MQDEEYDPTTCPVEGCDYESSIRSVAAHISGTHDDDRHSWDALGYDGARDFVMAEKRRQQAGEKRPDSSESRHQSTDDGEIDSETDDVGGFTAASSLTHDSTVSLDLDPDLFRDALVLLDTLRRYDTDSLTRRQLVNLYTLLSDVGRSAEDARKQVRDALIDAVNEEGELSSNFGSVRRYTAERRSLKADDIVMTELERVGIDPTRVMSLDRKKVEKAIEVTTLDPTTIFDTTETTRVRKEDADPDARRDVFDSLDPDIRALVEDR